MNYKKNKMNIKKKAKKICISIFTFFVAFTALGLNTQNVSAASSPVKLYDISGTSANVILGAHSAWWANGIGKIQVDGEIAFCIEPTTVGLGGTYSKEDNIPIDVQRTLSRIVYYGWDSTSKTDDDYSTTQFMVWEAMGTSVNLTGSFASKYPTLKANVQGKINKHTIDTSFNQGSYTVNLGESLTLTDTNDILNDFHIKSSGGATVQIQGNKLIITPSINTPDNTTITLQKILDKNVGASIAYRSSANDGQDVGVFRVSDPRQNTISLKVNKYVDVTITKEDIETGATAQGDARLIGASYSLYKSDDTFIETKTIGNDLKLKFERLMATDTYYIKETAAPEGYIINPEKIQINPLALLQAGTVGSDLQYGTKSKEQVITGNFELHKVITSAEASEITTPEKDAEFMVVLKKYVDQYGTIEDAYQHKSDYSDREYDYLTTDAKGYAKTKDLAYGTYVVKQIKGKVDTDNVKDTWEFVVNEEDQETIKYIVNNRPFTSYLKLIKEDVDSGKTITIDNATFKIFDKANDKYLTQKVGEEKHTEFKTNDKGYVVLPLILKAGEYRLDEIKAPNGYLINKDGIDFKVTNAIVAEVDEDGDPITIVTMSDQRVKGEVTINKTGEVLTGYDETNKKFVYEEKPLAGATIGLYAAKDILDPADGKTIKHVKDSKVAEAITDDEGKAIFDELYLGEYYTKEESAPNGYILDTTPSNVDLVYKDDETAVIKKEVNIKNERQKYQVKASKVEEGKTELLDGAEIAVMLNRDMYVGDELIAKKGTEIETKVTKKDGAVSFDVDLPTDTNYPVIVPLILDLSLEGTELIGDQNSLFYIHEKKAPESYHNKKVRVYLDTRYTHEKEATINFEHTFENKLNSVEVEMVKADSATEKVIKSKYFKFGQYEDPECTKLIQEVSADELNGTANFKVVKVGTTYFKEIAAPQGYQLSKRIVKFEYDGEKAYVDGEEYKVENQKVSFVYLNTLMPALQTAPSTGDKTNTNHLILLLGLSTVIIVGVIVYKKKKATE